MKRQKYYMDVCFMGNKKELDILRETVYKRYREDNSSVRMLGLDLGVDICRSVNLEWVDIVKEDEDGNYYLLIQYKVIGSPFTKFWDTFFLLLGLKDIHYYWDSFPVDGNNFINTDIENKYLPCRYKLITNKDESLEFVEDCYYFKDETDLNRYCEYMKEKYEDKIDLEVVKFKYTYTESNSRMVLKKDIVKEGVLCEQDRTY